VENNSDENNASENNSENNSDENNSDENNSDEPDADENNGENNDDNNDPPDLPPQDDPEEEDREPPMLREATPEPGQAEVSVDTNLVLTFNEPIRTLGLEFKILLKDVDRNVDVPMRGQVVENVATMDPTEPLRPGTPYQVIVTNQISDTSGNLLGDEVRWYFSTAVEEDAEHRALAERYAPVVFQEVDPARSRGDFFTRVDFDGEYDVADNLESWRDVPLKAAAYYIVIESETHWYIQYLYYYPVYFERNVAQEFQPHDLAATQVVVEKADGEASPEKLLMAETGYGQGGLFGFAVEGLGIEDRNQGNLVFSFSPDAVWEGTHYLAYHGASYHAPGHWLWQPDFRQITYAPTVNHRAGEFNEPAQGVVFYPGAGEGQGPDDLACSNDAGCAPELGVTCQGGTCKNADGQKALRYGLLDYRSTLWVRRTNIGEDVDLFVSNPLTYAPHRDSGVRPGSDEGRQFPGALAATENASRGDLPYGWPSDGSLSRGQWWLDPAYAFTHRYRFAPTQDGVINPGVSVEYCFHPYFDIDKRGEAACR
jgi:hypothetical protein